MVILRFSLCELLLKSPCTVWVLLEFEVFAIPGR